jgi:pyruvate dehydrogenase E2 component (dihydrolipoamide acetyltransferase)
MPRTNPLTRRLARDLGVDLEQVRGTGRGGRITRADVQAAAGRGLTAGSHGAAAPHPPEGAPHPQPPVGGPPAGRVAGPGAGSEPPSTAPTPALTPTLAATPTSAPEPTSEPAPAPVPASATLPLVHLIVAVDAEALLDLQDDLGGEVSVPDLVTRACATALRADPGINAALGDDALTVTHLNVDQLRPPIDPPATAVLSFGAVLPEVVATGEGIEVRRRMRLTLSVDDRALDGATGARFLGQLKAALEQPLQILT